MDQESIMQKIGKKINAVIVKIFGANWRTSVLGLLAILPQIAKPMQDFLEAQKVSAATLNIVSLAFSVLFVLAAKDKNVTGGTMPNDTGKPNG